MDAWSMEEVGLTRKTRSARSDKGTEINGNRRKKNLEVVVEEAEEVACVDSLQVKVDWKCATDSSLVAYAGSDNSCKVVVSSYWLALALMFTA